MQLIAKNPNEYGVIKPVLLYVPYYENVDGSFQGPFYSITVKPKASLNTANDKETNESTTNKEDSTNTGDSTTVSLYIFFTGISLIIIFSIFTKKRRE